MKFLTANAGLLLSLGLLVGCGNGDGSMDEPMDGPSDEAVREPMRDPLDELDAVHMQLGEMGLVHDAGYDAYYRSFKHLSEDVIAEGDFEAAELIVRGGLLWNPPDNLREDLGEFEIKYRSDVFLPKQRKVSEILGKADPSKAMREWDSDARLSAANKAMANVPDSYKELIRESCGIDLIGREGTSYKLRSGEIMFYPKEGPPLYFIDICVGLNLLVIERLFEMPGRREFGNWGDFEFGIWEEPDEDPTRMRKYIVITESEDGGAVICEVSYTWPNIMGRTLLFRRGGRYEQQIEQFTRVGVDLDNQALRSEAVRKVSKLNGSFSEWGSLSYEGVESVNQDEDSLTITLAKTQSNQTLESRWRKYSRLERPRKIDFDALQGCL